MCSIKRNLVASPVVANLAIITLIVVFLTFAECAAGSCLSYGHACWGAHGKRSGHQKPIGEEISSKPNAKTRWFLSKLVQNPYDFRYFRDDDYDLGNRQPVMENYEENKEHNNRLEDWENNQNSITTNDRDQPFEEASNSEQKNLDKYFKTQKYLDKRSVTSH